MATQNLYLDPLTNDLAVGNNYNLRVTESDEYLAQKMSSRLQFFFGEWYLNDQLGVPYYEDILKKSPDFKLARSLLLIVVTTTTGVDKVLSFDATFDGTTRTYTVDYVVLSSAGETVEGQIVVP